MRREILGRGICMLLILGCSAWSCDTRSVDTPQISTAIDGVVPQAAQVKSVITIRGSRFIDPYSQTFVRFDGENADSKDFLYITDNEIAVRVPNAGRTGDITVRVQNETSNGVPFTVFGPWVYLVHGNTDLGLTVLDSHIRDTSDDLEIRAVLGVPGIPEDLATTPEGDKTYLALPEEDALLILDAPNNTVLNYIQGGIGPRPSALAITKKDKHRCFIANRGDRSVTVLDTLTDTVVGVLEPSGPIQDPVDDWGPASAVLDPDYSTLYVVFHNEGILRAYWVDTLSLRSENPVGPKPIQLLVLPNNGKVYSLNQGNPEDPSDLRGSISVVRARDQLFLTTIVLGEDPTRMEAAGNTFVMITNRGSDSVTVLQADGETIYKTITDGVGQGPSALTVSDDVSHIYAACSGNGVVSVIDRNDLAVEKEILLAPGISSIQYRETGEGSRVFVLNPVEASVTVLNVEREDNKRKADVIATTSVAGNPLFMRVQDLTTYPPDE